MLSKENYMGRISITDTYIRTLICRTVSGCFGIAGMKSSSFKEFILNDILKLKTDGTGVYVSTKDNELIINLHIAVTYGTNVSAVVKSVKNKVEFVIAESICVPVHSVNVYVDSIKE